jgi:hypothetical protein
VPLLQQRGRYIYSTEMEDSFPGTIYSEKKSIANEMVEPELPQFKTL